MEKVCVINVSKVIEIDYDVEKDVTYFVVAEVPTISLTNFQCMILAIVCTA